MRLGEVGGIIAVLEGEGEGDLKNAFLIPLTNITKAFCFSFFVLLQNENERERERESASVKKLKLFVLVFDGESWWGVFIY